MQIISMFIILFKFGIFLCKTSSLGWQMYVVHSPFLMKRCCESDPLLSDIVYVAKLPNERVAQNPGGEETASAELEESELAETKTFLQIIHFTQILLSTVWNSHYINILY